MNIEMEKFNSILNLYKYDLTDEELGRFLVETGKSSGMEHVKSLDDIQALSLNDTVTYFLKSPYNTIHYRTTCKVINEVKRRIGFGKDAHRLNLLTDLHSIIQWTGYLMNPSWAVMHNIAESNDHIFSVIIALEAIEYYAFSNIELATHLLQTLMSITTNLHNYIWLVSLSCLNRSGEPFTLLVTLLNEGKLPKPELNESHPLNMINRDTLTEIDLHMPFRKPSEDSSTSKKLLYNFVVRLNDLYNLNLYGVPLDNFIEVPAMTFYNPASILFSRGTGGSRKVRNSRKRKLSRKQKRHTRKQN